MESEYRPDPDLDGHLTELNSSIAVEDLGQPEFNLSDVSKMWDAKSSNKISSEANKIKQNSRLKSSGNS